jgi:hypothetical protein
MAMIFVDGFNPALNWFRLCATLERSVGTHEKCEFDHNRRQKHLLTPDIAATYGPADRAHVCAVKD